MYYEVNDCCDCAVPGYPCLGNACSFRHSPRYVCDICGEDDFYPEQITHIDGEDVCDDCKRKMQGDDNE